MSEGKDKGEDRFTWQEDDLHVVADAGEEASQRVVRFILMRHDPERHNHAYLYEWAQIVETVGDPGSKYGVDIVAVYGSNRSRAEFNAEYQSGRLASGLEAVGNKVFDKLSEAREDAEVAVRLWKHLR